MTDPLIKFIESVCVQTAVYWGNPVPDGYGGMGYDQPVEIDCRWDESINVVINNNGKEVVSKAEVLLTQDVDEEGLLYLGSLDDFDFGAIWKDTTDVIWKGTIDVRWGFDPMTIDKTWKIIRFDKTPLFKSTSEFVRKAYL